MQQRVSFFSSFFRLTFLFCSIFFSFVSCKQKETQITSSSVLLDHRLKDKNQSKSSSLKEKKFIFDARSTFEYKVSHFRGAIQENWKNFFNWKKGSEFLNVKSDLDAEVKKFSYLGIHPNSSLIIYGNGKYGKGEEWALAWVFLYLNFKNVQVISLDQMKKRGFFINEFFDFQNPVKGLREEKIDKAKSFKKWELIYNKNLIASTKEIEDLLSNQSFFLKGKKMKGKTFRFWFVHLEKKNFLRSKIGEKRIRQRGIRERTLRLYWKEALSFKLRRRLEKKLLRKRFQKKDRIFVLGGNQIEALAVTASLYLMGYKNSAYFEQGKKGFFNLLDRKTKD